MSSFEEAYAGFLTKHKSNRKGEGLRRLEQGLGHGEKLFLEYVWWPAVGHFDHLHPEYEIQDYKGGTRFLDFAYVRHPYRICLEIDGYGPHQRQINRWQFSDQRNRQNHLVLDNWKVFRFSYDEITENPKGCQQTIQQILGKWYSHAQAGRKLSVEEREIIRFAIRSKEPISTSGVCNCLDIGNRHARALLHRLKSHGILAPASGNERVTRYALVGSYEWLLV